MAWAKFDDQTHRRRKIRRLSDAAWRLWASAIMDCCAEGSDGLIDGDSLRELLPRHHDDHVRELVAAGLLHDAPGCKSAECPGSVGLPVAGSFVVHDFGQWQLGREEWAELKAKKQRAAHVRWHKGEAKPGCRFCFP